MISINIFKVVANVGNLPLCSGVIAVPSGPKSHTFTVILAVFAPQPRWRHKLWKVLFDEWAYLLWGTDLGGKRKIWLKILPAFFWTSVVKGSCTAEELRVSLEKKKTKYMEKYLLFSRNIRMNWHWQRMVILPFTTNSRKFLLGCKGSWQTASQRVTQGIG